MYLRLKVTLDFANDNCANDNFVNDNCANDNKDDWNDNWNTVAWSVGVLR